MKAHTISAAFRECLGERTVRLAFFSTYSFEPDFFELEVIPLLFGDQALSTQEDIRYVQLQALMQAGKGRFAVAHDADVFNPTIGSRLEVDYLPVRVAGACQHAKFAILVVEGEDGEAPAIILAAGSFNLTKAGWWDNIEVGHFVELRAGHAPANILEPLRRALAYFQATTPTPVLDGIVDVQKAWSLGDDHPECSFYFSGAGSGRLAFLDFLRLHPDLFPASNASAALEIISPFFGEQPHSGSTRDLMSLFATVRLMLPRDELDRALIEPAVFDTFGLGQWCGWAQSVSGSHKLKDKPFRRLHAKIFQGLGKHPWQFVGSVNFSHKAFNANVEAGFLLRGRPLSPLLEACEADVTVFAPDTSLSSADTVLGLAMPVLRLGYDWHREVLEVTAQQPATGTLRLLDSVRQEVAVMAFAQSMRAEQAVPGLRQHLERSSLITARWQQGAETVERCVMVSQQNVHCRPSQLPAMDLQSLLRLLIDMRLSRKVSLFGELAQLMISLRRSAAVEDEHLSEMTDTGAGESFFAEFSQVNGAFWQLDQTLGRALAEDDTKVLAYYLTGCQPDSLTAMLDSVKEGGGNDETLVVRYLTLVSLQDVLTRYSAYGSAALMTRVQTAIAELEKNELLRHFEMSDGPKFLHWFRTQFQRRLVAASSPGQGAVHASDQ